MQKAVRLQILPVVDRGFRMEKDGRGNPDGLREGEEGW